MDLNLEYCIQLDLPSKYLRPIWTNKYFRLYIGRTLTNRKREPIKDTPDAGHSQILITVHYEIN